MNPTVRMSAHERRRPAEPLHRCCRIYVLVTAAPERREAPGAVILPFKLPLAEVARREGREGMSGPKWTPGPWHYGEVSPYEEDAREISIMATNPRTKGPYCVAVAIPCGAGRSDRDLAPEMTEANAHLIAAAPELCDELERLLQRFEAACASPGTFLKQ